MPVVIDVDTNRYVVDTRTGERLEAYEHVYTEYDVGRIRAGYCCIHCGEAQVEAGMPKAFPERCAICHFPMKAEQAQRFAEEFEGYTSVGPSRSLEELRAEDEEAKERARRRFEGKPTSRIWLPS